MSAAAASMWADAADRWIADHARVELIGAELGRLAMDELDPAPGMRVLDVGCGTGRTTDELGRRVAPDGMAVGVDISAPMLAAAPRSDDASVRHVRADAQRAPFAQASFDRVYSRFGVMFFGDPHEAFTDLRRVLRSDGRLAFVSWQPLERNEWMHLPATAAELALDRPLPAPPSDGPGPFSLSDPATVRTLLAAAGYGSISVTSHEDHVPVPVADAPAFAAGSMGHGGIRAALAGADRDTERRVQASIVASLRARARKGVIRLARAALVVAATPASDRPELTSTRVRGGRGG